MKPVYRRRRRKTAVNPIGLAIAVSLCIGAAVGIYSVLSNWSFFEIKAIEVSGGDGFDGGSLEYLKGQNLLKIDLKDIRETVCADPAIESAEVRSVYPGKIAIKITRRVPLCKVRDSDGSLKAMDGKGNVFSCQGLEGLPLLAGSEYLAEGLSLCSEEDLAFGGYKADKVDCDGKKGIIVTYINDEGDTVLCNFGKDGYKEKLSALNQCKERLKGSDYADLRFLPYVVLGNGGV